jgi:hypothetical protein
MDGCRSEDGCEDLLGGRHDDILPLRWTTTIFVGASTLTLVIKT